MTHFVKSQDALAIPGMVIRTACGDIDYVGPDGTASIEWTTDSNLDGIDCPECRFIASVATKGASA